MIRKPLYESHILYSKPANSKKMTEIAKDMPKDVEESDMRERGGKATRENDEENVVQDPSMHEPISTCTNSPSISRPPLTLAP